MAAVKNYEDIVVLKITGTGSKNDILILDKANGHLYCVTCKLNWCDHLQNVVKENKDSAALFERNIEHKETIAKIAIIPSENLWAEVRLASADSVRSAMEVYLILPAWHLPDKVASTELPFEFLGLINPGEGRMVIRSMIQDWFMGQVPKMKNACGNVNHGVAAEVMWQQDTRGKNATRKFMQLWSVFTSSRCLACNKPSQTDFSDLIPDSETNRPW